MIDVHYFANVREMLGVAHEQLPADSAGSTVSTLIEALVQRHGSRWQTAFNAGARILVAVNQEVVPHSATINDGDEVAFFPPVTGG